MNQRVKAIVLSKRKYREYDELVWLYTSSYGILSTIIHGIKRKRSRYNGELSLFSIVYVDLKITSGLSTIYDFELVENNINEKNIFLGYTYGAQISELLRKVLPEREPISGMFELVAELLKSLQTLTNPELAIAYLEQKIIAFSGIHVILDRCVICQSKENIAAYSYRHHGLICNKCQQYIIATDLVDKNKIKLLVAFSRLSVEKMSEINLSEVDREFIINFWKDIYEQELGIVLKSQKVLASMKKMKETL